MAGKDLINEYRRERRNAAKRVAYWRKRGYEIPDDFLPAEPKTVTRGSINRIKKYNADYIRKHATAPAVATESKPKLPRKSATEAAYDKLYTRVTDYIKGKAKQGMVIEPPERTTGKNALSDLKREYEKIKIRARRVRKSPQKGITLTDPVTREVTQLPKWEEGSIYNPAVRRKRKAEEAEIRRAAGRSKPSPITPKPEADEGKSILTPDGMRVDTSTGEVLAGPDTKTLTGYDSVIESLEGERNKDVKIERLENLIRQEGRPVPERYPAEFPDDYINRLERTYRILGYEKVLMKAGIPVSERGERESYDEYLTRMATAASAVEGKQTITERRDEMQRNIINSIIAQKGYNPYKPVDETDEVTAAELADFVISIRDEMGINLPKWAKYKDRNTLMWHFIREKPETLRNRMYDLQKDLSELRDLRERNARRDAETTADMLPTFDDVEDVQDALNRLVETYGYLPAGDTLKRMRDTFQRTLETHTDREVRDYLKGVVGDLLTALDESVSQVLLYHLQKGQIRPDDVYVKDEADIFRMLNMGQSLSFREAMA